MTAEFYNCAVEVMRGAEAHRRVHRPAAAGSVRHRVLAARRGQAAAHAARERAGAAGRRGGRRRQRHRQGHGAPRCAAKARTWSAPTSTQRRPKRRPHELTGRYGVGIGVAGTGISGCGPAIGLGVDITERDSVRALLRPGRAGLRRPRRRHRHGRHLRAARPRRAHPGRELGARPSTSTSPAATWWPTKRPRSGRRRV